jgi:hypothetical protein
MLMLPQKLTNVLTILISLVWTANVVAGFIRPELRDPMINAIFALVVGAIYALGRKPGTVADARRRLGELVSGNAPADADAPADNTPQTTNNNAPGGER